MKRKYIFFPVCFFQLALGFLVYAQEINTGQSSNTNASLSVSESEGSKTIMLARSSADYRVTPGDVYTLAYAAGSTSVSYIITVDASYRIRVSNLGIVDGAGKTFMQLKNEVEAIVANNYPLSGVQLVLTQPAVFKVYVTGEVYSSGEVSAWGLSRLSSLTGGNLTSYASIRDISVESSDGQTKTYDLFKAQRLGELDQDPYLRSGDVITFQRVKRTVRISGEVERPGSYQLLDGENLKELVEYYGNGLTAVSDISRTEVVRIINSKEIEGEKLFINEQAFKENYALENYDEVIIPAVTKLRPVMFVEGAVANADEMTAARHLVVQFMPGDTYASLVRANMGWFSEVSDTRNAYILRGGERIQINLDVLLYDKSYRGEVLVEENDVLIIPFRQFFVTVAGAVINPGRYPYIPDRDWEYYISLAGGFIKERNFAKLITIRDSSGKRLGKTSEIVPETIITAETNQFLFFFNQYAPIVTTTASIITVIVSLILMNR